MVDLKAREIKWIIRRHSPLSLENKILIYETILKPVWTYGIELWGCDSNSNIEIENMRFVCYLPVTFYHNCGRQDVLVKQDVIRMRRIVICDIYGSTIFFQIIL